MKWLVHLTILLTTSTAPCIGSDMLILTGLYSGKNLYVQNPLIPGSSSFSTEQVFVNEQLVLNNPRTSAFTIDLSHLSLDQSVEVRITHKESFKPRIINAHVIRNLQMNETESYQAVSDIFRWTKADKETIRWLTHGEKGGGYFEIQKAHKESWLKVLEVKAKATDDNSVYKVFIDHTPGENAYRVKLVDRDGYVSYSTLIKFTLK